MKIQTGPTPANCADIAAKATELLNASDTDTADYRAIWRAAVRHCSHESAFDLWTRWTEREFADWQRATEALVEQDRQERAAAEVERQRLDWHAKAMQRRATFRDDGAWIRLAALVYQHDDVIRAHLAAHRTEPFIVRRRALGLKVLCCEMDDRHVIAFRGSSGLSWGLDPLIRFTGKPPRHAGFDIGWEALRVPVREWLRHRPGTKPVVLTGHSLGGAIATVAALELHRGYEIGAVVTIGSPRPGGPAFVKRYQRRVGHVTRRYVNADDVVTRLPPAWKYAHVSDGLFVDANGNVSLLRQERDWDGVHAPFADAVETIETFGSRVARWITSLVDSRPNPSVFGASAGGGPASVHRSETGWSDLLEAFRVSVAPFMQGYAVKALFLLGAAALVLFTVAYVSWGICVAVVRATFFVDDAMSHRSGKYVAALEPS